jgi:hypothetical protein
MSGTGGFGVVVVRGGNGMTVLHSSRCSCLSKPLHKDGDPCVTLGIFSFSRLCVWPSAPAPMRPQPFRLLPVLLSTVDTSSVPVLVSRATAQQRPPPPERRRPLTVQRPLAAAMCSDQGRSSRRVGVSSGPGSSPAGPGPATCRGAPRSAVRVNPACHSAALGAATAHVARCSPAVRRLLSPALDHRSGSRCP